MKCWFLVCVLACSVVFSPVAAHADAPKTSIRPKPRVILVVAPDPALSPVIPAPSDSLAEGQAMAAVLTPDERPKPRPATLVPAGQGGVLETSAPMVEPAAAQKGGLFGFLRPSRRPDSLVEKPVPATALRTLPGKAVVVSKKGSVCGDPDIRGEKLAPIAAKVRGCGISDPVRITSVAGVNLSTPATVTCDAAKAFKSWIKKGVEPVYGKGKVVQIEVFASYACRPRNNKKGAKISEHGRGNAIDVGGLVFSNGKSVSVLRNYDRSMRRVHKAACGIFGTTLGPGSDGYHENHLHFDVARYRSGPYCR